MPIRISEALSIPQEKLKEKGVYDSLLDFDSRLHIDPSLIESSGIKELINAKRKIVDYFTDILRLLKASQKINDTFWKGALKRISTGEGLQTSLGYSEDGTKGSGIGPLLGQKILETIKEIQNAGDTDPLIFELVGVFESNIGPDRISDWIAFIIHEELCEYTKRVCIQLNITLVSFKIFGREFFLPKNKITNNYLVFIPASILNNLPIAESWDDIETMSSYNQEVRDKINKILGRSWENAARARKDAIKEMFIEMPDILNDVLAIYKRKRKEGYDFEVDHLGDMLWDALGYDITRQISINLNLSSKLKVEEVFSVVISICNQFKNLIENNGLVEHLWDANGKKRPERFPQLLLFAVSDSYCQANNLDLSREPNAGSGALDFKFSQGLAKVTCEIKYSSNNKLVEGYEKQLIAYNMAEKVEHYNSIYLILRIKDTNDHKIEAIKNIIANRESRNLSSPHLIIIDAIKKPSASKR